MNKIIHVKNELRGSHLCSAEAIHENMSKRVYHQWQVLQGERTETALGLDNEWSPNLLGNSLTGVEEKAFLKYLEQEKEKMSYEQNACVGDSPSFRERKIQWEVVK